MIMNIEENNTGNHVRMETNLCPCCLAHHKRECGILLDSRLQDIPEEQTLTGYSMCEKCHKLKEDGYVALIELSDTPDADKCKLNDVVHLRTGRIMHIASDALQAITGQKPQELQFIGAETFEQIQELGSA